MAVADYDIGTLASCKAYMGITTTDSNRDAVLQTLISDCSAWIEYYTGRTFAVQTFEDEILDGNGRAKIRPKHIPIYLLYPASATTDALKLACLQERDDIDSDWEDVETDLDHFWANTPQLRDESPQNTHCIELYDETFTEGKRTVKLSYRAGYAAIPGDVHLVFLQMVQRGLADSKAGDNQLAQTNLSDSRSNINISLKDMKPEWLAVLDRYKVRYQ